MKSLSNRRCKENARFLYRRMVAGNLAKPPGMGLVAGPMPASSYSDLKNAFSSVRY